MAIMVVDVRIDLHTIPLTAPAGGSKDTTDSNLCHHPHMIMTFIPLFHQYLMQTTPSILRMNHHICPIVSKSH